MNLCLVSSVNLGVSGINSQCLAGREVLTYITYTMKETSVFTDNFNLLLL